MKLLIISHKLCWASDQSASGYATDGGFPIQVENLSYLFDTTQLLMPVKKGKQKGLIPLAGKNVSVIPLFSFGLEHFDYRRKLIFPFWLLVNLPILIFQIIKAESVHTPLPSDVGLIGSMISKVFHKPLFIRYGGNWMDYDGSGSTSRLVCRLSRWFINSFTNGNTVSFVTGTSDQPPSVNENVKWIFSTSLKESEIEYCQAFRHALRPGKTRIIYVGRLEWQKGIDKVVESIPLIRQKIPNVELVIVGTGQFQDRIVKIIEELQLDEHIKLLGRLSHEEVITELGKADIFCFPSQSEGFPKVVVEAMACGLPVVTSNVSVLPFLVGNDCGRVVPNTTPQEIAAAVVECVKDPGYYSQLSKNAVEKIKQYSLENWSKIISKELSEKWNK